MGCWNSSCIQTCVCKAELRNCMEVEDKNYPFKFIWIFERSGVRKELQILHFKFYSFEDKKLLSALHRDIDLESYLCIWHRLYQFPKYNPRLQKKKKLSVIDPKIKSKERLVFKNKHEDLYTNHKLFEHILDVGLIRQLRVKIVWPQLKRALCKKVDCSDDNRYW